MITISALLQKLNHFQPQKQYLTQPDCPLLHVFNGPPDFLSVENNSVYILTAQEVPLFTKLPINGLFLILSSKSPGPTVPEFPNYVLFPLGLNRMDLYLAVSQALSIAHRIEYAHYRLSQCLLERSPMENILKVGAELLENSLFLSDTSTRVIQFSDVELQKEVNDELIQCVIEHGFVTSEYFEKYNYATLLPFIEKQEKAFHQKSEYEKKKERLIVKVIIDHRYFGWIVVIPNKRPFQEGDCEILDILTKVLSLELERNKIGFALSYRENLLLELLTGHIFSLEEFKLRAEGFDWSPGEHFYAMAISFQQENNKQSNERTIIAYKNHLALIYPTYKAICIGNTLLLLLETADLTSVTENLRIFFQTYQLAAGCSRHFSNILELKAYCDQATAVLKLGLILHPERVIYQYQDYYLPYMVSVLEKHSDLKGYCLPQLIELHAYDIQNNTPYIETLKAYLRFRNALSTAQYLHIHRNTMNYRLQKIKEITHLNLTEGEDLYKIWFSLMILDLKPDMFSVKHTQKEKTPET